MNSPNRKPAFEPNAYYERVLDLRRTDPKAFDSLAPVTRLALYAYETAKREHTRLAAIRQEKKTMLLTENQRRQQNRVLAEQRREREERARIEVEEQAERQRQNDAIRERRLAALAKAESDAKAARRDAAQQQAREHEAELKAQARATWTGTEETFNRAWPQMLETMLIDETRRRTDQNKAVLRARQGMYSF